MDRHDLLAERHARLVARDGGNAVEVVLAPESCLPGPADEGEERPFLLGDGVAGQAFPHATPARDVAPVTDLLERVEIPKGQAAQPLPKVAFYSTPFMRWPKLRSTSSASPQRTKR